MGFLSFIRDLIPGLVPFGGTMSVPSADDQFPIAIANEIYGGSHGYRTLEELAGLPKLRMQKPMQVIVLQHLRPDSSVYTRRTLILDPPDDIWQEFLDDPALNKISDIPGYDLSLFWKELEVSAGYSSDIQSQYAAPQDYGRVGDPAAPAFLLPLISEANYQLGRKSNADSSIIWSDTYDPTIHQYERQRLTDTGKWGIPKQINATAYTAGDYLDNRFKWVLKGTVPSRPSSIVNGQSNGEPAGWQNTPEVPGGAPYYTYILTYDLFQITASKDAFGILKSEWSTPKLISTDPTLVRYGNEPSAPVTLDDNGPWRGYYSPGIDTHMATRLNVSSPWRIQNIDNESGEYVDFIFKAFPISYEPLEADRPTISNPFSEDIGDYPNNGWKDYPFEPATNEILYRSVGRKYNNGQLKPSGWSLPTRADGADIIQSIIKPVNDHVFKYDGSGAVIPASIMLEAVLYRGDVLVTPDVQVEWYKGAYAPENKIIFGLSTGVSQYHTISGTNHEFLSILPDAVDGNQLYTIRVILSGEDYFDTISIIDVSDGYAAVVVIEGADGFIYKNATGSKDFTVKLYSNGALVSTAFYDAQWFLGGADITVGGDHYNVSVDAADFTDKEALKVSVTFNGNVIDRIETLVDVSDAPAVLIQYTTEVPTPTISTVWTSSPTGAVWMRISRDNGATYDSPIKVRGESAPYNGGFQRSAYKNAATVPVATGLTAGLIPTEAGWAAVPTTPGPGEYTWETTAFFTKIPFNLDGSPNTNVALTSSNWAISGSWSVAMKKTAVDGAGSVVPGPVGPVGWSPVIGLVSRGANEQVQKVIDWINLGGALIGTKPPVDTYYIGVGGYYTDINNVNVINVRGIPGPVVLTTIGQTFQSPIVPAANIVMNTFLATATAGNIILGSAIPMVNRGAVLININIGFLAGNGTYNATFRLQYRDNGGSWINLDNPIIYRFVGSQEPEYIPYVRLDTSIPGAATAFVSGNRQYRLSWTSDVGIAMASQIDFTIFHTPYLL